MRALSLIMLLFLFCPEAFAAELRGDWESAGDAPRPYEPKYDFEYDCQLELKGKEPYVAATRFTLRNKSRYFETDKNTHWEWVGIRENRGRANPKKTDLQLEGYYVVFALWPAEESAKDRIDLRLGWKLNWKDVKFTGQPYEYEFTRADASLNGRFSLYVNKAKRSEWDPLKAVEAQLNCDKVK